MILLLMLFVDVALMCYLAWKVGSASRPNAPQDLGWLQFRDAPGGARKQAAQAAAANNTQGPGHA